MAIFEAEHQRKTASEDQLTSRIFGALSIMNKDKVLIPFLCKLIEADPSSQADLITGRLSGLLGAAQGLPRIALWEHFGYRCPDVYIHIPKYLIVIEVKERTRATSDQIVAQYRSVKEYYDGDFAYYLLTKDEGENQAIIDEARKRLEGHAARICWVRWKQVWEWLKCIAEDQEITGTDKHLLNDLVLYLGDKKMKHATEIKAEWFSPEVVSSVNYLNDLYKEMQLVVQDLRETKIIERLGLEQSDNVFDSDLAKRLGETSEQSIAPSYVSIIYKDRGWEGTAELQNGCIHISAYLSEEPRFVVGFWNEDVSDDTWEYIQTRANTRGLRPESLGSSKGKNEIDVTLDLIGGKSERKEVKENILGTLSDALEQMRDFVRECYEI
jgi:hypothetical protein